ncbi:MAG: hypothetical protein AAGL49_06000 [Pseudomonadota bacterium]
MRLQAIAAAFAALFAAVSWTTVQAEEQRPPLSEKDVQKFVEALDKIDAFADRMEAEGKLDALEVDTQPKPGEPFRPYANSIPALKEVGEYDAFAKLIKAEGFRSPEAWADIADPVIATVINLRMEEEDPGSAQKISQMEIPPELLNDPNIPPALLEQMKGRLSMVQSFADVPEQHKSVVRPHMPKLIAWMEENDAAPAP